MVDLAWKILLHDKLRFAITISGVAFAVTLVFVQVGLFEGLLDNASITIERDRRRPLGHGQEHPNVDFSNTFSETLVQRVRSVPGVARADNLIVWFGRVAAAHGRQGERGRSTRSRISPLEPALERRGRATSTTSAGASS